MNTLNPLSDNELIALTMGDRVRMVDKRGRVTQGVLQARGDFAPGRRPWALSISGRMLIARHHEIFAADCGGDLLPDKYDPNPDELRDIIAGLGAQRFSSHADSRAELVDMADIITAVVGYDPSIGLTGGEFGGRSRDGWWNEHVFMSRIRRNLDAMVAVGTLVEYRSHSATRAEQKFVRRTTTRRGWMTSEAYGAAREAINAQRDQNQIDALREEARGMVADAHTDEVEARFQALLAVQHG